MYKKRTDIQYYKSVEVFGETDSSITGEDTDRSRISIGPESIFVRKLYVYLVRTRHLEVDGTCGVLRYTEPEFVG